MFYRFREQFGTAGLVVAIVALIAALAGGAVAATGNSGGGKATASAGKQGPRGKTGKTGPAGPQGPAGANGKDGADGLPGEDGAAGKSGSNGKNGSNGKSVTVAAEATGTGNCEGRGGASIETEGTGTPQFACNGKQGLQGVTGDPWTAGGTLPSGAAETGVWSLGTVPPGGGSGFGEYVYIPASFQIPLEDPLGSSDVHFLKESFPTGASPEEVDDCPGSVAEPKAKKGKFCVYTHQEFGLILGGEVISPSGGGIGTGVSGALLQFTAFGPGTLAFGTWAVTGS
jgi:hypothetical protein